MPEPEWIAQEIERQTGRPPIKCSGCGIPIADPGENPDPDALLCDTCYAREHGEPLAGHEPG